MQFCRVYSVKEGNFALLKKNPPDIVVTAMGQVATSGWRNGHLTPWLYVRPPQDGIQDFDFVAEKPTGIVLQALQDIAGDAIITDADIPNFWGEGLPLHGFRIHASQNSIEVLLDEKASGLAISI